MSFTSTDAKTIVLHFYNVVGIPLFKREIPRQTVIAKELLENYSVDEIKEVIDRVHANGKNITSLGYIPYVIADIVKSIRSREAELKVKQMNAPPPQEIITNNNNKDKVKNFGVKKDWGEWGI